MAQPNIVLRIFNYGLFIVLCGLGVLFLLAAPVVPSMMVSRLLVGILLIVFSIILLIVISLLIHRREYLVVKEIVKENKTTETIPFEIICKNCKTPIELTGEIKKNNSVICQTCGVENIIQKDDINW